MAWKKLAFYDEVALLATGTDAPTDITPDATSSAGSGTVASAFDHIHAIKMDTPGTIGPDDAAAEGASTGFVRGDHTHGITALAANDIADATAAEGSATGFARSDHIHGFITEVPDTITADATAAEGTSTGFSRGDHVHAFTTAAPSAVDGNAAAEGAGTGFVRNNHIHALGPLVAALDFATNEANGMCLETTTAGGTDATGQPDTGAEKAGQMFFSTSTDDYHAWIWQATA